MSTVNPSVCMRRVAMLPPVSVQPKRFMVFLDGFVRYYAVSANAWVITGPVGELTLTM